MGWVLASRPARFNPVVIGWFWTALDKRKSLTSFGIRTSGRPAHHNTGSSIAAETVDKTVTELNERTIVGKHASSW